MNTILLRFMKIQDFSLFFNQAKNPDFPNEQECAFPPVKIFSEFLIIHLNAR